MDTTRNRTTQSVYLNIPSSDWQLLKDLSRKFGWQAQTSEQRMAVFVKNRPDNVKLSEDDIVNEVRATRYTKK